MKSEVKVSRISVRLFAIDNFGGSLVRLTCEKTGAKEGSLEEENYSEKSLERGGRIIWRECAVFCESQCQNLVGRIRGSS